MADIKKESLLAALQYCSLRTLPDVEDGENVWVQALALVAKRDGTTSYALVQKDGDECTNRVIKDFGSISMIVDILEFYPTMYLFPEYVPEFDNNKKEPRIWFLRKMRGEADYSQYTLKELNKMVISTAIQRQLEAVKQQQ